MKRPESRNNVYLAGMMIGLLFNWIGFILYLVKLNYYSWIVNNLLYISPKIWSRVLTMDISKDVFVTAMDFGVSVFVACVLLYAFSYTKIIYFRIKASVLHTIIACVFLLQFVLFCPYTYTALKNAPAMLNGLYHFTNTWLTVIYRNVNLLCLTGSLLLFLYDYLSQRKLGSGQKALLYNFFIMFFLVAMHLILFSWLPMLLVRPSVIYGYFTYRIPDIENSIRLINIFPLISLALMCFIFYFSYRYREAILFGRNIEINFDRSMQVASQSARIYTHSMKNHLVAIQSEAEFLETLMDGNEEAGYSLKLILDSCRQAQASIDFGNKAFGSRAVHLKMTPLSLPIEGALENVRILIKNIDVTVDYPETIPVLYLDAGLLKEVFSNLFTNAAEAILSGPHPGEGQIHIAVRSRGRWMVVTVKDNGCGMDEETRLKAMEPFFSTKSSSSNWGMGLSLCQKIIGAHQGMLNVESTPGEGTRFDVVLPKL
ncbi:MAG: HAMP domain-containing histidine kinase [Hungatella hathewayi]|nr:HAMP domain-containing histidine kinase [Hungatella hathewayi]